MVYQLTNIAGAELWISQCMLDTAIDCLPTFAAYTLHN